jgi:hypothetical protein
MFIALERKPHRDLKDTRVECSGFLPECATVGIGVGIRKLRVIEDVESFEAKLSRETLGDFCCFGQG